MAMGDRVFNWIASGSTATSAATAHNLFGTYNGLSLINADEAMFVQISATLADIRISGSAGSPATNNTGLRITVSASNYDLPPVRAGNASELTFVREGATNATILWTLWVRKP